MELPNIALTGPAGSGKDTIADYLNLRFGYQRLALADPVREMAYAINPMISPDARLRDAVDAFGWDGAKKIAEVRRLLQVIGTEGVRGVIGEETWIRHLADRYAGVKTPVVVTDVRYPNEAEFLTGPLGFHLVRVEGRAHTGVPLHVSESLMTDYPVDSTFANVGSKDDLHQLVDVFIERNLR